MKRTKFVLSWLAVLAIAGCLGKGGSSAPSNNPPSVSLSATPISGAAPLVVQFTANASDNDGSIIRYEWDFDYNGVYDNVTTTNTLSYTYVSAGSYSPKVRVTDDDGAMAEANTAVNVSAYAPTISFTATGAPVNNSVYLEKVSTNNDEIILAIKVKGGSNVWAASAILNIGPNIKYVSRTSGDYLPVPVYVTEDADNSGILVIGTSKQRADTTGVNGDGTLVTIKLRALASQLNTAVGFNTAESSLLIYTATENDPTRYIQGTTWLGGSLSYQ